MYNHGAQGVDSLVAIVVNMSHGAEGIHAHAQEHQHMIIPHFSWTEFCMEAARFIESKIAHH